MTVSELRARLEQQLDRDARAWLADAEAAVGDDPRRIQTLFPAAGRNVGRRLLNGVDEPTAWTADDAARALLLLALGEAAIQELPELFRYGDADEQRAIVRSLHLLLPVEDAAEMVGFAARSNDPRMVAASLGPWALEHMDDEAIAQSALKCVFADVPLEQIKGLPARATPRMAQMLCDLVLERVAAGRGVPANVWPLIDRFPPHDTIASIEAEQHHDVPERRAAARAALAARGRQESGCRSSIRTFT